MQYSVSAMPILHETQITLYTICHKWFIIQETFLHEKKMRLIQNIIHYNIYSMKYKKIIYNYAPLA
jgi:hypothetical protein